MRFLFWFLLLIPTVSIAQDEHILVSQLSYSNVNNKNEVPTQTTRFVIEHAAVDCGFDGIELSMDALVHEGGDDLGKFKAFVECLKDDIGLLKLPKHFEIRLKVDFVHYEWIDCNIRPVLVKMVLDNIKCKSWTLRLEDYSKDYEIGQWLVIYGRALNTEDSKFVLELPKVVNTRAIILDFNRLKIKNAAIDVGQFDQDGKTMYTPSHAMDFIVVNLASKVRGVTLHFIEGNIDTRPIKDKSFEYIVLHSDQMLYLNDTTLTRKIVNGK